MLWLLDLTSIRRGTGLARLTRTWLSRSQSSESDPVLGQLSDGALIHNGNWWILMLPMKSRWLLSGLCLWFRVLSAL